MAPTIALPTRTSTPNYKTPKTISKNNLTGSAKKVKTTTSKVPLASVAIAKAATNVKIAAASTGRPSILPIRTASTADTGRKTNLKSDDMKRTVITQTKTNLKSDGMKKRLITQTKTNLKSDAVKKATQAKIIISKMKTNGNATPSKKNSKGAAHGGVPLSDRMKKAMAAMKSLKSP